MPAPRSAIAAVGGAITLALAVPALAARTTVTETLREYKISGPSSAKPGTITFRAKNSGGEDHELVVIKTATKAAKLKTSSAGKASETGKVDEVEVSRGKTKTLKLTLSKGHYALICNISDHYSEGMRKDFTVK